MKENDIKDEETKTVEELLRRAWKLDISVSELCRIAGVDRSWMERLKKRIPKGVDAYIKIDEYIAKKEEEKANGNKGNTRKAQRD